MYECVHQKLKWFNNSLHYILQDITCLAVKAYILSFMPPVSGVPLHKVWLLFATLPTIYIVSSGSCHFPRIPMEKGFGCSFFYWSSHYELQQQLSSHDDEEEEEEDDKKKKHKAMDIDGNDDDNEEEESKNNKKKKQKRRGGGGGIKISDLKI